MAVWKRKSNRFSEIDKITLEGSPNSECGVIYKKGVKKPFMKIRMIDKMQTGLDI